MLMLKQNWIVLASLVATALVLFLARWFGMTPMEVVALMGAVATALTATAHRMEPPKKKAKKEPEPPSQG